MKISLKWIGKYVSLKGINPKDLADKLLNLGIEVEEINDQGKTLRSIEVIHILEINKHPNADRLSLCKIQRKNEAVEIVCGAKNMKAGDYCAYAPLNTVLPDGLVIKEISIRCVISCGMLCSRM